MTNHIGTLGDLQRALRESGLTLAMRHSSRHSSSVYVVTVGAAKDEAPTTAESEYLTDAIESAIAKWRAKQ